MLATESAKTSNVSTLFIIFLSIFRPTLLLHAGFIKIPILFLHSVCGTHVAQWTTALETYIRYAFWIWLACRTVEY